MCCTWIIKICMIFTSYILSDLFKSSTDLLSLLLVPLLCFPNLNFSLTQFIPPVPGDFRVASMRLLLDISYTVIVTTIGLNIVLGIIVDSFSQLKNERVKFAYNLQILHCSWCNVHHSVYTIQHVSHYHTRV